MKAFATTVLLGFFALVPPAFADHHKEAKKDIVDTAVAAGSFKTLAAALGAADLVETMKGEGPFTVFAPDGEFLLEVAQGNERAMEHCIAKYSPLVWSIAKRYVQNHSAVEDVVQETFTDLWKSAKRFNPSIATESTFVGLLARRRAIDFARKESRRPQLEPMPEAESLPHAAVESATTLRCEVSDIRAALQELSEETRKIFLLHFDAGMTHPEIVEKTGLPLGTVKTRLRRGLIDLRNKLARLDNAQQFPSATP